MSEKDESDFVELYDPFEGTTPERKAELLGAPKPAADAPPQCAHERPGVWSGTITCVRRGYAEYNGKFYCKQHHPPSVQARDDARQRKANAERAEYENRGARAKRYAEELGFGEPHFYTPIGGSSKGQGWTGGLVLTEDETRMLLAFLEDAEGASYMVSNWKERSRAGTDA